MGGILNRGTQVHHVKRDDLLAKEAQKEIDEATSIYNCEECNSDDTDVNGIIDFAVDEHGDCVDSICEETITCKICGHSSKLYFDLN